MQASVADFIEHAERERNFTRNSVDSYRRALLRFAKFLEAHGVAAPSDVADQHVLDYLVARSVEGVSPSTRARDLVALRAFFLFLLGESRVTSDPTVVVELPRAPRLLPDPLSQTEVERLIEACGSEGPLPIRDRAMVQLTYSAGLRVSELLHLKLVGVDLDAGTVRVYGKGRKEREVPIGGRAGAALRRYLEETRPLLARRPSPYVFLSRRNEPLTRATFHQVLQRTAKRAGVEGVHAHRLRHATATDMFHGGADIRTVQAQLGHECVSTTQIYTHVSLDALRRVYFAAHPMA